MVSFLKLFYFTNFMFNAVNGEGQLKRRKRWLIFPKGSSVQLVYCFLVSDLWTRDGIFVVGITLGLAWEIPTNLRQIILSDGEHVTHARQRRQLYSKLTIFLDKKGVNGESCLLRAVCEAKHVGPLKKFKFLLSFLHALFTYPDVDDDSEEHLRIKLAQEKDGNCSKYFPCNLTFQFM